MGDMGVTRRAVKAEVDADPENAYDDELVDVPLVGGPAYIFNFTERHRRPKRILVRFRFAPTWLRRDERPERKTNPQRPSNNPRSSPAGRLKAWGCSGWSQGEFSSYLLHSSLQLPTPAPQIVQTIACVPHSVVCPLSGLQLLHNWVDESKSFASHECE
ncbi:hypothetical protein B0H12DRAFT_1327247 [Mycena haematopus]|nr:hypothetical protein B0H12DRAFT_1327247 [Mycena haematopus]